MTTKKQCGDQIELEARDYQSKSVWCFLPSDHTSQHEGFDVAEETRRLEGDDDKYERREATVTIHWTWDEWKPIQ